PGAGMAELDPAAVMGAVLNRLFGLPSIPGVQEVTLCTLSADAVARAQALLGALGQSFLNDVASGSDLLNVDAEISALAETPLLREVEPPLVVGVFGGWGSGKSFAMQLIQRRMAAIRSLPVSVEQAWPNPEAPPADLFPWVGHAYAVWFDAWTFAKSNLWA